MASRNYIVYSGQGSSMTATDQKEYKLNALAAGLERCALKGIGDMYADMPDLKSIPESKKADRVDFIKSKIRNGWWPRSVDQRELTPGLATDLVVVTAIDSFLTAAFAAVNGFYSCFQAVAAPQLVRGKLMVVWGISIDSIAVPMPASRVLFRRGGAAGNIQAQFDLEPLGVQPIFDGLLSEPVVIDDADPFAIQVRARNATAVAEIVHLHNFLFENSGAVIA